MKQIQGEVKKLNVKRILATFVGVNLLCYLFLPVVFFGIWGTVRNISGSIAESRKEYHIRATRGRTVLELYQAQKAWKGAFKGATNWWR